MADSINPPWYTDSPIEVVHAIIAWRLSYCAGHAVRYLARAGKKNPATHVEDLRKAIRYIEFEIERLGGKASL